MRLELTLLAALTSMSCAAQADAFSPIPQVEETSTSPITTLEDLRLTKGIETTQPLQETAILGIIEPKPPLFSGDSCPACGRG